MILIKPSLKLRKGIFIVRGVIIIMGHNVVNPRYTLVSIMHFHTLMEEGPSVRNIKTVRLLSF